MSEMIRKTWTIKRTNDPELHRIKADLGIWCIWSPGLGVAAFKNLVGADEKTEETVAVFYEVEWFSDYIRADHDTDKT